MSATAMMAARQPALKAVRSNVFILRFRLSFESDNELTAGIQRDRINPQTAVRVPCRLPGTDVKTAGVQWAHQRALAQNAVGKRASLVRARGLSRKKRIV